MERIAVYNKMTDSDKRNHIEAAKNVFYEMQNCMNPKADTEASF